jgi:proteasome accessory factor C
MKEKMKKEKGCSRTQIDKLNQIVIYLRKRPDHRATKQELAEFLEISPKSIQRNIRALIDHHGYHIEIQDWKRGGYVLKDPMAALILMDVSSKEVVSVLLASRCLEEYAGTPFEKALRSAFKKLTSLMRGVVKVDIDQLEKSIQSKKVKREMSEPENFEKLAEAIKFRFAITFDYLKPAEQMWQPRKVEPYLLYYAENIWYVVSFDLKDNTWKKFAISRMKNTTILAVDSTHGSTKEARQLANDGMGPFFSGESQQVRLWMDAKAAWFAAQMPWHPTQVLEPRAGGAAVVSLEVSGLQDLARKVMEWCPHVTVLEPVSLKEEMEQQLEKSLFRHRNLASVEAPTPKKTPARISRKSFGLVKSTEKRDGTAQIPLIHPSA